MAELKLSIITPTLNVATVIETAIKSAQAQKGLEIEHLILDGGSSDGTLELVGSYPHLTVIREPDEGIYDAMNKGLALASGDWIYFMGADDFFADENVIADLAPHFSTDIDVVYGDVVSSRFGGRHDGAFSAEKILHRNICHQAIFFHRRVFDSVGTFNKAYKAHADWDHNMRWLLSGSIRRTWVDRVIAVYADGGYSSVTEDPAFKRDRRYRYLQCARDVLPRSKYFALWLKEVGAGLRHLDWNRFARAWSLL